MTIWINSFPKSGTALMRQALSCHGRDLGHLQMFSEPGNEMQDHDRIVKELQHWSHEQKAIATGHLHYHPAFLELMEGKTFFLVRDPRDVVVSHAHFVYQAKGHHMHARYQKMDWEERLYTSIWGDAEWGLPNIADRFLPYLGWGYQVPVVRFEDVAEDGVARRAVFLKLRDELHLRCTLDEMNAAIDRATSPTFRKGEVGGYVTEMQLHTMEQFDFDFGWLLDLLEYKRDE